MQSVAVDMSSTRHSLSSYFESRPRLVETPDRPTLLVVDDEPSVGRTLTHVAEECGYRAKLSINAAAFRAQYELDPPQVVMLDLSLPGGDGIELLRFLAERNSQSTVFIVSGFDRRVLEAARRLGEALGLNMGGTLTKPVMIGDFEQAMASANRPAGGEGGTRNDSGACFGA